MFCESYLLLFVKLHKHSSSSMSKATFKTNKSKSRSRYRLWVPPCPRYITSGDTQRLCVVCLGVKHAEAALEGADCPHCERLPLRTLHCRRVLFEEGAFTSVPRGAGPTSAEAERRLHSWGSQLDLAGESLSSSSPARSTDHSVLLLSSFRGGRCGEWCECGYRAMPWVEQTLAGYLSPVAALSLKTLVLPSKSLRTTSASGGKGAHGSGSGWHMSAHYVSVTGEPSRPAKETRWGRASQF